MKTKITSIALLVLVGLFTSTESAKAYIHMPDDLTWDADLGIFPVITQPAAAYYSAQRAYDAATSANDSATSAYNAATSAYNAATISREAATSAYNAARSAYDAASVDWYYNYNNPDIGIRDASFAAITATTATYNSVQPAYDQSVTTLRAAVSSANAVPEPSTYGLIGIGALGVAFAARRRKQKTA